ncbi:hypothetical protein NC653_035770 [Populus alba x Populus x berolinensis]|uniref:Uncharacterized protein n=1 Tax=Populus alba x Populus x berolinensis TaxID=444605 RepID=A0AAD6LI93_9ROSI|nr:hypothetical protein NC653_035770 [Populus alba x Populus x berolinensis]
MLQGWFIDLLLHSRLFFDLDSQKGFRMITVLKLNMCSDMIDFKMTTGFDDFSEGSYKGWSGRLVLISLKLRAWKSRYAAILPVTVDSQCQVSDSLKAHALTKPETESLQLSQINVKTHQE